MCNPVFCLDTKTTETLEGLLQTVNKMRKISFTLVVFLQVDCNEKLVVRTPIPVFHPNDQKVLLKNLKGGLRFICRDEPGTILKNLQVYDPNQQRVEEMESRLKEQFQGKTAQEILALS